MTLAPVATQSVASLDLSARAMTRPARPDETLVVRYQPVPWPTFEDVPLASMADEIKPGTPLADRFAEIAAKLREIEADKARDRAKPDTTPQPPYYSYGVGDA